MVTVTSFLKSGHSTHSKGGSAPTMDINQRRALAEKGDVNAQVTLGNQFFKGEGVQKDEVAAAAWFRLAADKNDARAQSMLGYMYRNGKGVPMDLDQSFTWTLKAAAQGEQNAQFALGNMYRHGKGAPLDITEAARWYAEAARQGNAQAKEAMKSLLVVANSPALPPVPGASPEPAAPPTVRAVALYSFAASQPGQISVSAGDIVEVLQETPSGWWKCKKVNGETGMLPANYLNKKADALPPTTSSSSASASSSSTSSVARVPSGGATISKSNSNSAVPTSSPQRFSSGNASMAPGSNFPQNAPFARQPSQVIPSTTASLPPLPQGSNNSKTGLSKTPSFTRQESPPPSPAAAYASLPPVPKASSSNSPPAASPQSSYTSMPSLPSKSGLSDDGSVRYSILINTNEITLGEVLGAGAFGTVHKGKWKGIDVAVKILHFAKLTPESEKEFKTEAEIMIQMRVPFIVTLYGVTISPQYMMVMEYCSRGSLHSYLNSEQDINWSTRYKISLEVARGLAFLHDKRIMHRDLKSHNVLLDQYFNAKLADFGLSKTKSESVSSIGGLKQQSVGTVPWMAPELFSITSKYGFPADIYSLGMVFWEIASRSMPYENAMGNQTRIQLCVSQGQREEIPADTPAPYRSLIEECWRQDPAARPTIARVIEILEHVQT